MSSIIAVAGNLASGKSTLASVLAAHNGWDYAPCAGYDVTYIEDLFRDPERWAFEAQLSFLDHKAAAIREAMVSGRTTVLDRSIGEDICIFARYFHRRGWMSERSHRLYESFARTVVHGLTSPAMLVYCYAPPEECAVRLRFRPRPYQELYPPDHLHQLHRLYESWWMEVPARRKVRIDTTRVDVRSESVGRALALRIARELAATRTDVRESSVSGVHAGHTLTS